MMWGYCVRQEVREGFSEEETLSENCMISRRQIPGREEMGEDREYGVSMMGTHTGRCGRKVIDEDSSAQDQGHTGQPQALGTCGGGAEHLPQSSTEAFRDGGGVTRFAFAF